MLLSLLVFPGFALIGQETPVAKPAAVAPAPASDPAFTQLELLTRAMEIVRQNYVDEKKVTYEQLIEGALEGMLRKLDPHCEYMGRSLFEEMQQEQRDSSEGVGITIALRQGALTIIAVDELSPAAEAGVLANDQIIRIGDVLTDNMSTMEVVQHLKGKAGEAVRITVRRPGTKQFLDFNLVRQSLQETSVRDAMLLHEKISAPWKIGYVRITEFTQGTAKDLSNELDKLEKQGMQAFVLDLRNNPGGLINSAVDVCGEFLPPNTVVVTTEGRVASQNAPPYRTSDRKGKPLRKYPMAVLINQGSASGSELVAGALQDLKRALIVGTTSFGKGSVQTILPMPNGAALRLTTAKYYTPGHRTIHEHGIEPNIVSALTSEEEGKVSQWRNGNTVGEARALDLAKLGDHQLERATDVLKGLMVYEQFKQSEPKPVPAPEKPEAAKP
jgi:carboxyl-terminal processing protease